MSNDWQYSIAQQCCGTVGWPYSIFFVLCRCMKSGTYELAGMVGTGQSALVHTTA